MQETRGGRRPHGGDGAEQPAGTAEPVTLVDLDGAVTRIAPASVWTREQVRHPGDEPLFITRLERGQLWHRAKHHSRTWAHEVQVGPATVVSEGGRFHVVAEPDGGATITCLEGQVAVATQLTAALLLEADEAVSVAADGETCVLVESPTRYAIEPRTVDRSMWPPSKRTSGLQGPIRLWTAVASREYVVSALLALVALLLVILIIILVFDRGGGPGGFIAPI
ncbi:MAG: FecR family protein [Actinomycetota bacterium]|nr:FecR family protein [Actinomycetota bacterium]